MTPIAPHITAFFQKRLAVELRASRDTCDTLYQLELRPSWPDGKLADNGRMIQIRVGENLRPCDADHHDQ